MNRLLSNLKQFPMSQTLVSSVLRLAVRSLCQLCYIGDVMNKRVVFGFYFWFSVPGGREANV